MTKDSKIIIGITLLAALLYIPFIGNLHLFDWDEINFAESAREMIITHNYLTVQIFFEPFWEKPPLFIWFQVLSMKIFGVNEFAARFPNAFGGIVTAIVLFKLGKKMTNRKFGIIWSAAYGLSVLPFFYFKSGIIDPWFNLFIFLGLTYYFFAQKTENKKKYFNIVISGFFIGLAVLTKGPAAILIFGLSIFIILILSKFRLHLKIGHVLVFMATLTFVGGFWFVLMILKGNWDTVVEFVIYQIRLFQTEDAGHGGFPLYHFIVLLFGVFPATAFAIYSHKKRKGFSDNTSYYRMIMLVLFWVVLILFSIVKTKIVHYSSLCYFPLSFLAAYGIYHLLEKKGRIPVWLAILQLFTALVFSLVVILLPVFDKYKQWFIDTGKITHSFTIGNLQADPGWQGWEWSIGVLLILGTIFAVYLLRKGQLEKGFKIQAITMAVFLFFTIVIVVPKVEKYSQNAAIEFMKSYKNKDVYLGTLYKSYAMLFYTEALPSSDNPNTLKIDWLLKGKIDKPAYFIVRKDKLENNLQRYPDLELLYEKNGYGFLMRKPISSEE